MLPGPTQLSILVALLLVGLYARHLGLLARTRSVLVDRFHYGVPWGTVLVVTLVLSFYLFAQGGLRNWQDPLTIPYRSWSYFSPLGMVTAGFAHGSAGHITGNLLATVVLSPIAEYAWGHYPPSGPTGSRLRTEPGTSDGTGGTTGWLRSPWIRALVVFPAIVVVVSLLTSLFALFFSLGFSGTVFAFGGLALVYYPLRTIVAMIGMSVVRLLYLALTEPVLRATADPGAPGPPSWFGINQQAHILGLLIGVLLGVALLARRDRRPKGERVFLAVLLFAIARGLFALPWAEGDVYFQYRGLGLLVVLALTVSITAAVATSPRRLVAGAWIRLGAFGWLALVGLGALGLLAVAVVEFEAAFSGTLVAIGVGSLLFSVPALFALCVTADKGTAFTRRQTVVGFVVVLTVIVALPSLPFNLFVLGEDPNPGTGGIDVRDYHVTYEENVTAPRVFATAPGDRFANDSTTSGVVVVSEQREIWTTPIRPDDLARNRNVTVPLGSIGWRESVRAERTGWSVTGNDSVYVVDLHHDGETTRSFESEPSTAAPRIAGYNVTIAPAERGFELRVSENGTTVETVSVPERNDSIVVAGLQISTTKRDGSQSLVVSTDGTRVAVAEREGEE
jgi:membrane associated rhomboid family serine protease